ncbi:metallophosphoesterase [Mucilaginibacter flavus]|uniref:metallophosphoesterase n=1 Tax=Mucilaginibacter flavus TaxID=931504 RepID=UPI0025B611BB|nr:metallophosphoesterase [Mucilaginibacter flavus]
MSLMVGITALNKPFASLASVSKRICTLHLSQKIVTIFHTNDLHGKMDAVYQNVGGINHIKKLLLKQETNGLVLDAGGFLDNTQGLPEQQKVIYAMNNIGYHAATIGNHELANGQDHLAALIPLMDFTLVNCNYTFDNQLNNLVKPYHIIYTGKFKIGITGVGHPVQGVLYNDAIQSANQIAALLKETEKCDLVICLSHLGYKQAGDKADNKKLAQQSEHIDMIIGGHNQKLNGEPIILLNKRKYEVVLAHAAWDGLMLGKTEFTFEYGKQKHGLKAKYLIPGNLTGQTFAAAYQSLRSTQKEA